MAVQIIPSIIAKNQKEFDKRFEKIKNITSVIHLDIMDSKFVTTKSLLFDLEVPRGYKYQAHFMVEHPLSLIQEIIRFLDVVVVHFEAFEDKKELLEVVSFVKKKKKKIGLAINPATSVAKIQEIISRFDSILIMSVEPGFYGAKFLPRTLTKVKKIRELYPRKNIIVDGSVNEKTIGKVVKAGANGCVVGSYLQNADDVKGTYKYLQKLV